MPVESPLLPVDDLVAALHRGPLETPPWHDFLDLLSRRMKARGAALVLRLSRAGLPPLVIWNSPPDISDADARRIRFKHAALGHLDPLRNALTYPGAIYTLDEVIDRAALLENEFYQQVLRPYRLERMIGMYISEPGGWEGNVGVTNGADDEDFGEEDRAMLLALRPHLEQSLAIFARLMREETEVQALTDTLDRLTISTFILSGKGRILRANSAARRLLADADIVREKDGRLFLTARPEDAAFQRIVNGALTVRRSGGAAFAQALRVEGETDRHVGVLVRAIDPTTPYADEAGPACIVYISGTRLTQPLERLVSQLFDLTPSEAHLAALLAAGSTLAEAAERLELTENTVRTYCKTIMAKVGVSRQTDLVRLILQSVAVLG